MRNVVIRRDAGICVACGLPVTGSPHLHHRKPRGMGGSGERNRVSNLILLHASCHLHRIEQQRAWAIDNGWLIVGDADPADVPVRYRLQRFVLLDDAGNIMEIGDRNG
jgi:HNH endonuclease